MSALAADLARALDPVASPLPRSRPTRRRGRSFPVAFWSWSLLPDGRPPEKRRVRAKKQGNDPIGCNTQDDAEEQRPAFEQVSPAQHDQRDNRQPRADESRQEHPP